MDSLPEIHVPPYGVLQHLVNLVPQEGFTSAGFMDAVTLLHLRASSVGFISQVRDCVQKLDSIRCGDFGYSACSLVLPEILLAAWAGVVPGSFFGNDNSHQYYFESPFTTPDRYTQEGDSPLHTAVGREVDSLAIRLGIIDYLDIPAPADVVILQTDSSCPEAFYAAWHLRGEDNLYLIAAKKQAEDYRVFILSGSIDAFFTLDQLRACVSFSPRNEGRKLQRLDTLVSLESFGQEYLGLVEGIDF
ncbi:TPA: hypothetical protein HA241_00660 [Candidatus Woesearchaeota archaeon]|nr:hypothetical protein [Candidatus Woesearchaeota archaeon]